MDKINKSVCIGILARDCQEAISHNRPKIESLCDYFHTHHIVIVENDSTDGTKELLKAWSQEDSVTLDSFDNHTVRQNGKSASRISKMVELRNRLLSNMRQLPPSDYYIFIDIDIYDFDVQGIIKAILSAPQDWGALLANGRSMLPNKRYVKVQYDTYALLGKNETYTTLQETLSSKIRQTKRGIAFDKNVQAQDYFEVTSAFGGIGIYKYEALNHLDYQLLSLPGHQDIALCEHIPFHKQICDKGFHIYIARQLKVNYGILPTHPWVTFELYHFPLIHSVLLSIRDSIKQRLHLK